LFFSKQEKRASLENPRTPINSQTLDEYFNGPETASGVQVNEHNALRQSAVWACINILAESIATLPFHVYELNQDGTKGKVTQSFQSQLLSVSPNSEMTPSVWKQTTQGHIGAWGNGYSYIVRDGAGRPRELVNLLPGQTWPKRNKETGEIVYETMIDGQTFRIRPIDMLHIPGLSYDGLIGYSPISVHRQNIGLALAAEEYGSRFFSGDATVSGVIELPVKLADTSSLEASWRRAHSGMSNKHKIAVLEQGAKYQKIGIPPGDAQFLETRQFQAKEIARIYRIPPHMIADLENATFTNIEHQSLEFVKYTLTPWLVKWEEELTRKLFSESERGRFYVKINVEGLLRGDTESRYASYEMARNTGWMNINEIREKEDLNGIGPDGDEYLLVPNGYTDVNNDSGSDNDNDGSSDNENQRSVENKSQSEDNLGIVEGLKAHLANVEEKLAERVLAKEVNSVKNAYKKGGFDKVNEWYESNSDKMAGYINDVFDVDIDLCKRYLKSSMEQFGDSETVEQWESTRTTDLLCAIKLAEVV